MKKWLMGAVILVLLGLAVFYFFRPETPAPEAGLPDINPIERGNPFSNVRTNPFDY